MGDYLLTLEGQKIKLQQTLFLDAERSGKSIYTLRSYFVMPVKSAHWKVSGGQIYLWGTDHSKYEWSTGDITVFEQTEQHGKILEAFQTTIARETQIRLVSGAA